VQLLEALQTMSRDLDGVLRDLDPALLHPTDAVAVLEAAVAVEHRAAAVRVLVAERAAESGRWAREGHRRPEDWLATKAGTSHSEAAGTLDASAKLAELPGLDEAVRGGELSGAQAAAIGPAATAENEERLVGAAKRENHRDLRRTVAEEQARSRSAEDEARRQERIHRERYYRSHTDSDGAYRFEGKTTAAVGARIEAAIAAEAEAVFKAAYAEGRREPAAAYRADALENLLTGGGAKVDATVVVRVDEERLSGGEGTCETTSTGTVPVEEAIGAILAGAFVKLLAHRGPGEWEWIPPPE
jgi:hypothetical protein